MFMVNLRLSLWSDSSIQFDILDPEGNVVQLSKE